MELPGDTTFDAISSFILRISVTWGEEIAHGAGFVIGRLHSTGQLIVATARHVLAAPKDQDLEWEVSQFTQDGELRRRVTFHTGRKERESAPFRWHNDLDIAVITLPQFDDEGKIFAVGDEVGVRIINPQMGVSTGTRIAWAGFPWVVEDLLGYPELCYFEGVVSSMISTTSRKLYIADGHIAYGVSGGPVWRWSEDDACLEVVGIVSKYEAAEDDLPGFCRFEPINPIFYYLKNWHVSLPGGYDNFVEINHG